VAIDEVAMAGQGHIFAMHLPYWHCSHRWRLIFSNCLTCWRSCPPPAKLDADLEKLGNDYDGKVDQHGRLLCRERKEGWVTVGTLDQIQIMRKCARKGCMSDPLGVDDMYHPVSVTASGEREGHVHDTHEIKDSALSHAHLAFSKDI
jgi:hypothetical protein